MLIRKANIEEIDDILRVYEDARAFMAKTGNTTQWANGYPKEDMLRDDIAKGKLFVCEEGPMLFSMSYLTEPVEGDDGGSLDESYMMLDALADLERNAEEAAGLKAVFYFALEDDPTYQEIDGAWKSDEPYGVVHRIGVAKRDCGVGSFCMEWAQSKAKSAEAKGGIRIDTHKDNAPMRAMLEKLGYEECGTIICEDGTPRIAYQRVETDN